MTHYLLVKPTASRVTSLLFGLVLGLSIGAAASDVPLRRTVQTPPAESSIEEVGAAVIVPETAKPAGLDIRIERLQDNELPPIPPGMMNVTEGGGGYRFLPAGTRFSEPVKVVIPLEESAVADGSTNSAVHTYFWDEKEQTWRGLPRISTDLEKKRLVSETTHFTTMINAVLAPPEHPPPLSFNPNSIKDLAAADPAAGIDLIEPPVANPRGTAELSYPIRLPAGRGAYSPSLSLTYSSANGNGWVGIGWSLNVPQISIDTRWGVPRYDGVSDRYLLNGQAIVPIEKQPNAACVSGEATTLVAQYAPRRETFQRILKCSTADGIHWEVTEKDGTRFEYGSDQNSRLASYHPDEKDHVAIWFLRRVIDTNGNSTEFSYSEDSDKSLQIEYQGEPFVQRYLKEIEYTRHQSVEPAYRALLKTACSTPTNDVGIDPIVSGRFGFKVVTRCLLEAIDVESLRPSNQKIHSYKFSYDRDPYYSKIRLLSVEHRGTEDQTFYAHRFEYSEPEYVESCNDTENSDGCDSSKPGQTVPAVFEDTRLISSKSSSLASRSIQVDRTDETGNSGSFGMGISIETKSGSTGFGCSLNESVRIDVDTPTPEIFFLDIDGDRIPDRLWRGNGGVRVLLGTLVDQFSTDPDGNSLVAQHLGSLGRQKSLGGSGGVSASCSASSGGATKGINAGLTFSASTTGARSVLIDADGDGYLDLASVNRILPGLPHECRDGVKSDQCANGFCTCPDGLRICADPDELCFDSPKPQPIPSVEAPQQALQTPVVASPVERIAEVDPRDSALLETGHLATADLQLVSPKPDWFESGFGLKKVKFNANRSRTEKPYLLLAQSSEEIPEDSPEKGRGRLQPLRSSKQGDVLQFDPVVRQASGPWGPYTALENRLRLDPETADLLERYRSVLRWEVQHTGTIEIDARVRRKFLAGEDGVEISLVHVRGAESASNAILGRVLLKADEKEILRVVPEHTVLDVEFGDSLLLVTDPLVDNPVDFFNDVSLDDVRANLHIEYVKICQRVEVTAADRVCRTVPNEKKGLAGGGSPSPYVFDFPADFSSTELPRLSYWQLLPPIGGPRKNPDGSTTANRVIGQLTKSLPTESAVIARIRCEPFTADPLKKESWIAGKNGDPCSRMGGIKGGILWKHRFEPSEQTSVDVEVPLSSPFLDAIEPRPNDLVVLVHSDVERYSDLNTLNKNILAYKLGDAGRFFFPLANVDDPYPGVGYPLEAGLRGLAQGKWHAILLKHQNAQSVLERIKREKSELPIGQPLEQLSTPKICCPTDSPVRLGGKGPTYLPRRLLFEIIGEGGEVVSAEAIQWSPIMEIVTLHQLQSPQVATDETVVLLVNRAAVQDRAIHSYQDLNSGATILDWLGRIWGREKDQAMIRSEAFVERALPEAQIGYVLWAEPEWNMLTHSGGIVSTAEYFVRAVARGHLTAAALPYGKAKEYIELIEEKIRANEHVPWEVKDLSSKVFFCCGADLPRPDYADSLLLVRDIQSGGRPPKDIRRYEDVLSQEAILGTVKESKETSLMDEVFPGAKTVSSENQDEALNRLLAGETDALFIDASTLKQLFADNKQAQYKAYPCCPRGSPSPLSTTTEGVGRGREIVFGPDAPWRQPMPVVYRDHPAHEQSAFQTNELHQILEIHAQTKGSWYPFTVTIEDELGNALDKKTLPPSWGTNGVVETFPVEIPDPGFYYVKGFTEATFQPSDDPNEDPRVWLSPWLKDSARFAAVAHVELRDKVQTFEQLRKVANLTLVVRPNSPEEQVALEQFPLAKIEYQDDYLKGVGSVSSGVKAMLFDGALLWNPVTLGVLHQLRDRVYLLMDFAGMPVGPKEVPANLVTSDFGCGVEMPNLAGEVPYSFQRWKGGHKGFFYGQVSTDVDLLSIGPEHWCDGLNELRDEDGNVVTTGFSEPSNSSNQLSANTRSGSVSEVAKTNQPRGELSEQANSLELVLFPESLQPASYEPSSKSVGDIAQAMRSSILDLFIRTAYGQPQGNSDCRKWPDFKPSCHKCQEADCSSDRDGDRVPGCRDACPVCAEDLDGVEDHDGCPEGPSVVYDIRLPPFFGDMPTEPPAGTGVIKDPSPPLVDGDTTACFQSIGGHAGFCHDGSTYGAGTDSDSDDGSGGSVRMGPTLRRTSTNGISFSAGISASTMVGTIGANATWGSSESNTTQEYMDWSGDNIPDIIASGEVYISGEDRITDLGIGCTIKATDLKDLDAFLKKCDKIAPAVRENENTTAAMGVSFSDRSQAVGNRTTPGGTIKEQLITSAGSGRQLNIQTSDSAGLKDRFDINADGLPDLLSVRTIKDADGKARPHLMVRLNLGYRLGEQEDWGPLSLDYGMSEFEKIVRGQGGADTLNRSESLTVGTSQSLEVGFKVLGIGASVSGSDSDSVTGTITNYSMVDLNGDGIIDLVAKDLASNQLKVRYGTGTSFGEKQSPFLPERSIGLPTWIVDPALPDPGMLRSFIDPFGAASSYINKALNDLGDGLFVSGSNAESWSGTVEAGFIFTVTSSYYHKEGKSFLSLALTDFDGDGVADRVLRQGKESGDAIQVQRSRLGGANLLKAVERPLGGRIELTYEQASPTVSDPNPRWKLTRSELKASNTTQAIFETTPIVQSFEYEDPYYDRIEREFFGYRMVRTIRGDDAVYETEYANRDYRLQGMPLVSRAMAPAEESTASQPESGNTSEKQLLPLVEEQTVVEPVRRYKDDEGFDARRHCLTGLTQPLKQIATSTTVTPCDVWFSKTTKTITRWYEGQEEPIETAISFEYDDFGNLTKLIDEQSLTKVVGGKVLPYPDDDLVATITYDQSEALLKSHIVDRAEIIDVKDINGVRLRYRKGAYDERGNLEHHEIWAKAGGGKKSTLDLVPDETGFVKQITDTNGYWIEYKPDPVLHMFPVKTTDSLRLEASAKYDYGWQLPLEETDVNGQSTVTRYDDFGRLEAVQGPYELAAKEDSLAIKYSLPGNPALPGHAVSTNLAVDPDDPESDQAHSVIRTATYVDALGRTIQTQMDAEVQADGMTKSEIGRVISAKVEFDSVGRRIREGQPEFRVGTNFEPEKLAFIPGRVTSWEYDALDRVTRVAEPGDRVTRTEYGIGLQPRAPPIGTHTTKIIDPKEKVRFEHRDAADRLVAVVQQLDGRDLPTTYTYNPIGDLVTITDARANVSHLEYDLAGRRTAVTTPDTGRLEFGYDDNGNLLEKTDQELCDQSPPLLENAACAGHKIVYGYAPNSNRLRTITYPTLPSVSYIYGDEGDPACAVGSEEEPNYNGRICEVTDSGGKERRLYGALGELKKTTRITDGAPWVTGDHEFTSEFVYDSFGRMLHLTYPDGEQLTYEYDKGGQVKAVSGKKGQDELVSYVIDARYDEFGQSVWRQYGNGVITHWEYEPDTRRLHKKTIGTGPNGLSLSNVYRTVEYEYDKADNIETIWDVRGNAQEPFLSQFDRSYTYDDLHRLRTFDFLNLRPSADGLVSNYMEGQYEYDDVGNLTRQIVTRGVNDDQPSAYPCRDWTYRYEGSPRPKLPTSIGPYTFTYDDRGSILSSALGNDVPTATTLGSVYEWNDDSRLSRSKWGISEVTAYLYDADGVRLQKQTPSLLNDPLTDLVDRTLYANEYYTARFIGIGAEAAVCESSPCWDAVTSRTKSVYFDGERIGVTTLWVSRDGIVEHELNEKGHTRHFLHSDPVLSIMLVTNDKGERVQEIEYLPFGESLLDRRGQSDSGQPQRFRFDGKELDPETGLQYFGARYYEPRLGRWLSADLASLAVIKNLSLPRALNPFSFAANNPVSGSDIGGFFFKKIYSRITRFYNAEIDGRLWRLGNITNAALVGVGDTLTAGGSQAIREMVFGEDIFSGSKAREVGASATAGTELALGYGALKGLGKALVAKGTRAFQKLTGIGTRAGAKSSSSVNAATKSGRAKNQFRGPDPDAGGQPHSRFRTDDKGVTTYETYNYPKPGKGKRVDAVGPPHGGVKTPHTVETTRHVNPGDPSKSSYRESRPRPSRSDEIPRRR